MQQRNISFVGIPEEHFFYYWESRSNNRDDSKFDIMIITYKPALHHQTCGLILVKTH